MAARRRFLPVLLLALAALALGLYVGAGLWLPAVGRLLIRDDGPAPADAAVVLAGDPNGSRITGAAELVRRGFVPVVLVSGPTGMYDVNEADAAIQYITARGYPREWFVAVRHTASNTNAEARVLLDELARRGIHRFLLVTSNYHSRRAGRIFLQAERERGGGPAMRVIATPDKFYSPATWWRTRDGLKTAFYEWTKTLTSLVGI